VTKEFNIETGGAKIGCFAGCKQNSFSMVCKQMESLFCVIDAITRICKFISKSMLPMAATDQEEINPELDVPTILKRIRKQMTQVTDEARVTISILLDSNRRLAALSISNMAARILLLNAGKEIKLLKVHGLIDKHTSEAVEIYHEKRDQALIRVRGAQPW